MKYTQATKVVAEAPFGDLVLDDSGDPLVLISAGIGITPIVGILRYLAGSGSSRQVAVMHADRSPAQHAHRQELKEIVTALPGATLRRWYEDLGVRTTRDALRAGRVGLGTVEIPRNAQVYLCGPMAFVESVRSSLMERRIPEAAIHYEVFGPDTWLASA